jgi:CRISPR/Cas system CSM-associated protein Csm4 (group 5 of RAMP superfamily)
MFPRRYLPKSLSKRDTQKQKRNLQLARTQYKKGKYIPRPYLASFHSKPSSHVATAKKMYKIDHISPSAALARKTRCSRNALKQIVKKGEGAYYSSGSRPNQTAQSWAMARLASSITGANASKVDYSILEKGCQKNSRALRLAKKAKKE